MVMSLLLGALLVKTGVLARAELRVQIEAFVLMAGLLGVTAWRWLSMRRASRRVAEKLSNELFVDYLTRVYNSRYLDERLDHEMEAARGAGAPLSLLYIDLDNFKQINDTLGHRAGDVVLEQFGRLLRQSVRDGDIVGRMGGDEFLVILPRTAAPNARRLAVRIQSIAASHAFLYEGRVLRIRLSVGVSTYPDDAATKDVLLAIADKAMYDAKRRTRSVPPEPPLEAGAFAV